MVVARPIFRGALKSKKPDIKCLQQSIPRESLRALLDEGYRQDRKSNAGGKRIDLSGWP